MGLCPCLWYWCWCFLLGGNACCLLVARNQRLATSSKQGSSVPTRLLVLVPTAGAQGVCGFRRVTGFQGNDQLQNLGNLPEFRSGGFPEAFASPNLKVP